MMELWQEPVHRRRPFRLNEGRVRAKNVAGPDKGSMHFNFDFSANQVLWTLTFAGLLVLLVVLLGRDRVRRFPWFTAAMVMMALRMLASRLLFGRMPPVVSSEDLPRPGRSRLDHRPPGRGGDGAASLRGRRAQAWIIGNADPAGRGRSGAGRVGSVALVKDALCRLAALACLRLMQLFAQKADLLADVLIIQLGLLVVLFGRRFKAGWRSHTQQIVIGLSTASIAQLAVRVIWQEIALAHHHPQPGRISSTSWAAGQVLQRQQRRFTWLCWCGGLSACGSTSRAAKAAAVSEEGRASESADVNRATRELSASDRLA